MAYRNAKPCRCGSGLFDYDLSDAAGIFCAYVCEKCEPEVRRKYNPAIFNAGTVYSGTGEEEDIGLTEDLRAEAVSAEGFEKACTGPEGHSWVYSGTAYGGDDESYHGEGRCYCEWCGDDGDA